MKKILLFFCVLFSIESFAQNMSITELRDLEVQMMPFQVRLRQAPYTIQTISKNKPITTEVLSQYIQTKLNLKLDSLKKSIDSTKYKIRITTGLNASTGTATLVAGSVLVNTTAVKASSLIWVQYHGQIGVATSVLTVSTVNDGNSFMIRAITAGSNAINMTDTNTVKWWIIN